MAEHIDSGKKGEELAVEYLQQQGYTILHCNWRDKHLELDIIAQWKDLIVFVEVKTRKSNFFGEPEEWVDRTKQKNVIQAANAFLTKQQLDNEARFDIISVIYNSSKSVVNHITDAFSA